MATVFVYGTLQFPEVLTALIGRVPRSSQASIRGYQRYALKGQVFPAILAATQDSQVKGLVLFDLTPHEMWVFDEFEGDEYYKAGVQPLLEDGSAVDAEVYLWQDRLRLQCYGQWSEDEFRQTHLAGYTTMCKEFREQLGRL